MIACSVVAYAEVQACNMVYMSDINEMYTHSYISIVISQTIVKVDYKMEKFWPYNHKAYDLNHRIIRLKR